MGVLMTARTDEEIDPVPQWAKMVAAIVGTAVTTTVAVILWANSTFVSREVYVAHARQQDLDIARIVQTQESYATAERLTASQLSAISSRLTGIETKVDIVIEGMSPRNGTNGRH